MKRSGLVGLSGCSSAERVVEDVQTEVKRPDLEITGTESQSTSFGNVEVFVRVMNHGERRGSALLNGKVDVEGGDVYRESKNIVIGPGEYSDYKLEFDIAFSESLTADSYEYETWLSDQRPV